MSKIHFPQLYFPLRSFFPYSKSPSILSSQISRKLSFYRTSFSSTSIHSVQFLKFLRKGILSNPHFPHSSLLLNQRNFSDGKKNDKIEKEISVESIYQKKTQIEHILLRPDTYIGGIESINKPNWILENSKIVYKDCEFVPGLYKIFDEILVNAADNCQRDPEGTTEIRVDIDVEKNTISIFNNGATIPVTLHKTEGVLVPELVFGQLLTGSNFNDKIAKVTGGRNGYGAKLANIFSKQFTVEIIDSKRKVKYLQMWEQNMGVRREPIVTNLNDEEQLFDSTKVTFTPDLSKFGMNTLNEGNIMALMEKRVYDVAACNENCKVYFNGKQLPNSFKSYVQLYDLNPSGAEYPSVFSRVNSRWFIGIGISPSEQFQQISFVNSICTSRGGTHVNYIVDQITKYLLSETPLSKEVKLTPGVIRNHLCVYVNCLIENPAFDSQTKETLTSPISKFGSKCHLSKKFLETVTEQTQLVEQIQNWAKWKEKSELIAKARSTKLNIPKLYDANLAGTSDSQLCTLILTEGDSAKALAVSGLPELGRDVFGVFPLKGKILNVRGATNKQLMENEEINHVLSILGLDYAKTYTTEEERKTLRYGKVMLMVDQDHDGSHIKGLFINFIHNFWPNLLKSNEFLIQFITPIIKVSHGKNQLSFYTLKEYMDWKHSVGDQIRIWNIKYYKGLGTNTTAEAKEYFKALEKHRIFFRWTDNTSNLIEMAFGKDTQLRKNWLNQLQSNTFIQPHNQEVTYDEFINKELILFSEANNKRAIPSLMDGLKPGQRKVLYSCFKRKLKHEIKVAQLAGYVSEQTSYHHGEAALHGTIIGMAQDFVGSNNLPLLYPAGQFGSRLQGGKDAASPRYLFTKLSDAARLLFPEEDDPLLNYLNDDGQSIEPEFYIPIIPLVLVNGANGLGTGWSTFIPTYNPLDIIDNILLKLDGKPMKDIIPWIKGFNGTIESNSKGSYLTVGVYHKVNETTLSISELPIGTWVDDFKDLLEELKTDFIKNFSMQHISNDSIEFLITFRRAKLPIAERIGIVKKFKLSSTLQLSNMHLYSPSGSLKKYETPLQIIEDFFPVRKEFYEKRKAFMSQKLEKEVNILSNRTRFTELVASNKLNLINKSKQDLITDLENLQFEKILQTSKVPFQQEETNGESEIPNDNLQSKQRTSPSNEKGYDYLMNHSLWNLTKEKINELKNEKMKKQNELEELKNKSVETLWKSELYKLKTFIQNSFKRKE